MHGDDLSLKEVLTALAAAEYAAATKQPLDVLVTLDFGRLSIAASTDAQAQLRRFLKSAASWSYEHELPVAYIAVIERSPSGRLHAHAAMHVPPDDNDPDASSSNWRSRFRGWAKGYSERNFGAHIPRAVHVQCSRTTSPVRHWITVHYLLKGFDRKAVLVSAQNAHDGRAVCLGDILAFDYADPGALGLRRRIMVSGNLKAARRRTKGVQALWPTLGTSPDLGRLQISSPNNSPAGQTVDAGQQRPFQPAVLEGVFDVRRVYGAAFADFMQGGLAVAPAAPTHPARRDLIDVIDWESLA